MDLNMNINACYSSLFSTDLRYNIVYGGAGAGKSYAMAQRVVLSLLEDKGISWGIIRKVARTIKVSVFAEIKHCIISNDLADYFKINESDYSITCKKTKSTVIMFGVDDPEKIKSISQLKKIWIEEASELSEDEFKQIDLRLRGVSEYTYQLFLSFNPITASHWLKKRFFDAIDKEARVTKTTYIDNAFIDDKYKALLNSYRETSPYHYDVYCLGNWGNLSGQIYTNYDIVNSFPECNDVIYGLDFGFNAPTALVKIGINDNEFYVDEVLYLSSLTNSDLIAELKRHNVDSYIYCDSAEPQRIEELQRAGLKAKSSNKNVADGIDFIMSKKLHITSDSTNVIREIQEYSWRKKKDGTVEDEPVKFKDHAMDAMRYAIYTHCKDFVEVPVITMHGAIYPDKQSPKQSVAEMIASMQLHNRLHHAR